MPNEKAEFGQYNCKFTPPPLLFENCAQDTNLGVKPKSSDTKFDFDLQVCIL